MRHDELIGVLAQALPGLSRPVDSADGLAWRLERQPERRLEGPIDARPEGRLERIGSNADCGAATLHLRHPWLDIEAPRLGVLPTDPTDPTDPLGLLRLQSALPGGFKIVRRRGCIALHAELPVGLDSGAARDWLRRQAGLVGAALGAAVDGVRHAGGGRGGRDGRIGIAAAADAEIAYGPVGDTSAGHTSAGDTSATETPADDKTAADISAAGARSDDAPFDAEQLAERCTAGGWRASVVRDAAPGRSEVHVELASRTAPRRVVLSRCGAAIRAAVTLDTGALGGRPPESQQAVAVMLMRATRSLYWVRAFVGGVGVGGIGFGAAGFECLLVLPDDDQPLSLALDALATACELHGREAEALAESALLAHHYLAIQPNGDPARRPATTAMPLAPTPVSPDSVADPGAVDLVLV